MSARGTSEVARNWLKVCQEQQAEIMGLRLALHDAINRPMGVVPASAERFYSPELCDRFLAKQEQGE